MHSRSRCSHLISAFFAASLLAATANAWQIALDPAKGHVDFRAVGRPAMIKIHGKGEGASGTLNGSASGASGTLKFRLESLDTENNLRNEHMKKKYLETEKFPEATLTLKAIALPSDFAAKDFDGTSAAFSGDLSVHGVSHPVDGTVKFTKKGSAVTGDAHFDTKISDFKIGVPNYLGVTVADSVAVDVNFSSQLK